MDLIASLFLVVMMPGVWHKLHTGELKKGFQKNHVANSTVFILNFYILLSLFGLIFWLECLDFEENSNSQLPGSLSPGYKYQHAREIPDQLSFPPKPYLTV